MNSKFRLFNIIVCNSIILSFTALSKVSKYQLTHLKRRRSKCHSRIDESLGPQERKLLIRWPFFLHPQQTLEVQFSQSGVQRRKGLWEKFPSFLS